MAVKKSNTSPLANTETKTDSPTTTPFSMATSEPQTLEQLRRNLLAQEIYSILILIYITLGPMDSTVSQQTILKQLHTWPDTALKKFRERMRRIITGIGYQNSNEPLKAWADLTSSAGLPTSIPGTKWSSLVEAHLSRPPTTTDFLKRGIQPSFKKSKKHAKKPKKS